MTEPTQQAIQDFTEALKIADSYEYQVENDTLEFKLDYEQWSTNKYPRIERREYHYVEMEAMLKGKSDYALAISQLMASNATLKNQITDCSQDLKSLEANNSKLLAAHRQKYADKLPTNIANFKPCSPHVSNQIAGANLHASKVESKCTFRSSPVGQSMENTNNEILNLDSRIEDLKFLMEGIRPRFQAGGQPWQTQWLKLQKLATVQDEESEREAFITEKVRSYASRIEVCEHKIKQHRAQTDDPMTVGLKGYMIIFDINGQLVKEVEKEIFPGNFDKDGNYRPFRTQLSNKARKTLIYLEEQLNHLQTVQHINIKETQQYANAHYPRPFNPDDGHAYYCTYEKMGWTQNYWFLCEICQAVVQTHNIEKHFQLKHSWIYTSANNRENVILLYAQQPMNYSMNPFRDQCIIKEPEKWVEELKNTLNVDCEIGNYGCPFVQDQKMKRDIKTGKVQGNMFVHFDLPLPTVKQYSPMLLFNLPSVAFIGKKQHRNSRQAVMKDKMGKKAVWSYGHNCDEEVKDYKLQGCDSTIVIPTEKMKKMQACKNAIDKVEKDVHEFNKPFFKEYNRIIGNNNDPQKKKETQMQLNMRRVEDQEEIVNIRDGFADQFYQNWIGEARTGWCWMYGSWDQNLQGVKQGQHLLDKKLFAIPLIVKRKNELQNSTLRDLDGYAISALALNSQKVYRACRYLFGVKKWKERDAQERYTFYGQIIFNFHCYPLVAGWIMTNWQKFCERGVFIANRVMLSNVTVKRMFSVDVNTQLEELRHDECKNLSALVFCQMLCVIHREHFDTENLEEKAGQEQMILVKAETNKIWTTLTSQTDPERLYVFWQTLQPFLGKHHNNIESLDYAVRLTAVLQSQDTFSLKLHIQNGTLNPLLLNQVADALENPPPQAWGSENNAAISDILEKHFQYDNTLKLRLEHQGMLRSWSQTKDRDEFTPKLCKHLELQFTGNPDDLEDDKGYKRSNLKLLNNRQQSLMIMAMYCLLRQGRLNLLLIAETGTGKSAMAIAAVVYITKWCADFVLERLPKARVSLRGNKQKKVIMLYATEHLRERDQEEQHQTKLTCGLLDIQYLAWETIVAKNEEYDQQYIELSRKGQSKKFSKKMPKNKDQLSPQQKLYVKYESWINWYKSPDVIVVDECDLVMYDHYKEFTIWMDYWKQFNVIVVLLTATPFRTGQIIEKHYIMKRWNIKPLQFTPELKFEPKPAGWVNYPQHDTTIKQAQELVKMRKSEDKLHILLYCSDGLWKALLTAANQGVDDTSENQNFRTTVGVNYKILRKLHHVKAADENFVVWRITAATLRGTDFHGGKTNVCVISTETFTNLSTLNQARGRSGRGLSDCDARFWGKGSVYDPRADEDLVAQMNITDQLEQIANAAKAKQQPKVSMDTPKARTRSAQGQGRQSNPLESETGTEKHSCQQNNDMPMSADAPRVTTVEEGDTEMIDTNKNKDLQHSKTGHHKIISPTQPNGKMLDISISQESDNEELFPKYTQDRGYGFGQEYEAAFEQYKEKPNHHKGYYKIKPIVIKEAVNQFTHPANGKSTNKKATGQNKDENSDGQKK